MKTETDLPLYPSWREAHRRLREAGRIRAGETITRAELEDIFGIRPAKTIAQHEQNRLIFLRQFSDLREHMLETDQAMLRPLIGIGWEIVPPEDQTRRAMDDRMRAVQRQIAYLVSELSNIRADALTDAERADNANARAKVGHLVAMLGGSRRVDTAAAIDTRRVESANERTEA